MRAKAQAVCEGRCSFSGSWCVVAGDERCHSHAGGQLGVSQENVCMRVRAACRARTEL